MPTLFTDVSKTNFFCCLQSSAVLFWYQWDTNSIFINIFQFHFIFSILILVKSNHFYAQFFFFFVTFYARSQYLDRLTWLTVYYPIHNFSLPKKWKMHFSLVYLHMNQTPWTWSPHCWSQHLQQTLQNKQAARESESGCSSFAPGVIERTSCTTAERQAGVTCSEPRGMGGRRVRLHTCVNDTKQRRFISGRKQTGLNQISYRRASAHFSQHRESVYTPLTG